MKMKKILSAVIAVCMLFGVTGICGFAEEEVLNVAVVEGLAGEGTQESPYLINNIEELKWFRDDVNSGNSYSQKYVKLTDDIDLSNDEWIPIGLDGDGMGFAGTFDGADFTISNLYVDTKDSEDNAAGLFGSVRGTLKNFTVKDANVNNLVMQDPTVDGTAVIAGCTGYVATIDNVHIDTADVTSNRYIGGISGYAAGQFTNCTVKNITLNAYPNEVSAGNFDNGDKVGGIIGYVNSKETTIKDCKLSGTNTINAYRDAGGIAGAVGENITTLTDNKVEGVLNINIDTTLCGERDSYNTGVICGRGTQAAESAGNDEENVTFNVSVGTATARIGNALYPTLKDALSAANNGDVVIELLKDTTLDYNARDEYGTNDTTSIKIIGNNNTLTLNQKDSDWSSLANKGGTLEFENITINKTGYGAENGAWNTYAINFHSKLIATNTVFNHSICIEEGAVLNDVDINEDKDYYAIWITADSSRVSLDNVTVKSGGRGIKIADQYVNEGKNAVELKIENSSFETVKKAAVLVSSTAGAKIEVNNVDISKVAADKENVVWVDEDWAASFAEVEATMDGNKISAVLECAKDKNYVALVGENGYMTFQDAVAAATENDTISLLEDAETKTITLISKLNLNGKTLKFTEKNNRLSADVSRGTLVFDIEETATYAAYVDGNVNMSGVAIKMENVNAYADIMFVNGSVLNLTGSSIEIKNSNTNGGTAILSDSIGGILRAENSAITLTNVNRGMANMVVELTGSTVSVSDCTDNSLRNVTGAVVDSDITVDGGEYGLKNTNGKALEISGTSNVSISGSQKGDIFTSNDSDVTIKDGASLTSAKAATATKMDDATLAQAISEVGFEVIAGTTQRADTFVVSGINLTKATVEYEYKHNGNGNKKVIPFSFARIEGSADITIGTLLYNIPTDGTASFDDPDIIVE